MSKSLKKNSLTIHTLENCRIYIAFHSDRLPSTPLLSPFLFAGLVSRVPNRFSGIRDFPYLQLGIRDSRFYNKIREGFGIESMHGRWGAKNNPRDYGIARNLGSGLRD